MAQDMVKMKAEMADGGVPDGVGGRIQPAMNRTAQGEAVALDMQWYACRVKRKQMGGLRSVTVGGEFEAYRDRKGRLRKRRVDGTGKRVFLPEHLLRRAGFEVFLPIRKELRRKNRYGREKVLISYPLLVDWLFVGWPNGEDRWCDLMDLDVVMGVLGADGRAARISSGAVKRLMRKWGGWNLSEEGRRWLKTGSEFAVGDTVVVGAGPLVGAPVRVVDVTGRSVKAVVNFLGGEVEVAIDDGLLEPAQGGGR